MENYTFNSVTLQMEGLKVTEKSMYPVFFFFLFAYIFVLVMNVGVSVLIIIDRNLHQPMYLLFFNLSLSDIIGSTDIMPRLLTDCMVQAYIMQLFGTTTHTVLMIMAFDRYVAICNPLRYSVIMTNRMVVKLVLSAWGVAFVLVSVLMGLTIRLSRCRTLIKGPYCDNASLFKLSCESVFINNVYGLTFTVVLTTASIGSMVGHHRRSLSSKALKTCSTHLLVFLVIILSGSIIIIMHRFPEHKDYAKLSGILFVIVPGSLNPIIYGAQSKEIRQFFINKFNQLAKD
uniref:G-protein coupled receptors family 1 profile domain-containing protein n=1 Tax=Cynoglossus semilaevis TaxID=244447 RepID=A0A3P8WY91_CYNSE